MFKVATIAFITVNPIGMNVADEENAVKWAK